MLSITTGSISPDFCKGDDEFQGLLGVQVGRSSTGNLLSPMSRFTHVFTTSISTLFIESVRGRPYTTDVLSIDFHFCHNGYLIEVDK